MRSIERLQEAERQVNERLERVRKKLREEGQEHVLCRWDGLGPRERERFLSQLEGLDWEQVREFQRLMREGSVRDLTSQDVQPAVVTRPTEVDEGRYAQAKEAGEDLLKSGMVAVVTVAGGQGSRLGLEVPKGTLPISPVKGKSLFQLHAEKIRALGERAGRAIRWYIMTSGTNDAATREYFERNRRLGLRPEQVNFFVQGMVPALDEDGRLILDGPGHVFESPNGHGGTFEALLTNGMIDDMEQHGVEEVFFHQVDNALIRIADPVFLGLHRMERAGMSSKVCPKRDPKEQVGVTVTMGGRVHVIEYSDLPDDLAYARDQRGRLKFDAGNIAIHVFSVEFVRRLEREGLGLPWHVAHKKVTCLDESGRTVKPARANGYKFEHFVFDALPLSERVVLMEVVREDEFAPVKQSAGEDSIESAREAQVEQVRRWLESVGVKAPTDERGKSKFPLEISPLVALSAEDLFGKVKDDVVIDGPWYLGHESM